MAEVALSIIMTGGIAVQCFLVWLSYKQFESAKSLNDINESLKKQKIVIQNNNNENNKDDEDLLAVLKEHQARIKVIGVGGGGNNTLDRIAEIGIEEADIAVLTLKRGVKIISNPKHSRVIENDDVLLCYGKLALMKQLIPQKIRKRKSKISVELLSDKQIENCSNSVGGVNSA